MLMINKTSSLEHHHAVMNRKQQTALKLKLTLWKLNYSIFTRTSNEQAFYHKNIVNIKENINFHC